MRQNNKIIDFFGNVIKDHRTTPAHLSLYVALFQLWGINEYVTPFRICRKDVMQLSKIKSFATYHKCISELNNAGFIIYLPCYNPFQGSAVEIIDIESDDFGKNKILIDNRTVSGKEVSFDVPVLDEVELYFNERDLLSKDADQFYAFYQSNNWKLSNNKSMKCWKSAARSWISRVINTNLNKDS